MAEVSSLEYLNLYITMEGKVVGTEKTEGDIRTSSKGTTGHTYNSEWQLPCRGT